ncbi:MAG: phosphate regulon sensor histidine kinase PhoR [Gammaproteobacteria bacterium]|nr:phosphate regulon sensor histidine kinase PhoR [Gammaproteobacteria bacterium]
MTWTAAAARIAVLLAVALLFGWIYGYPHEAVIAVLLGLIVFWLYQMEKVQSWLQDPERAPPDAYGVWGDLLARIYSHQRKNRKTQNKLQANVTYLQDSFASMRDGVVMVDRQGAIKWFNKAAEKLLNLRYPEDTAQTLTNLVREPEFNAYFLADDYTAPLQYVTGGEKPRYRRVEITHFGAGERLLFVRDISESVRLEKMRTDFVANVSHELRTPLTVISGYLSTFLAHQGELPQAYGKALRQMSQQAERMETLLKDLLWLSRIETEQRQEKRELIDIGSLLQEIKEEFREAFPGGIVELVLETDKRVYGDYRELHSAFSNLLSNAIKYSPDGSPVIVRWYSQENKCIVEVKDQGIGIDAAHIPRLTERFYRVDDSRSSATGGTGLGLAIVKHVLAAHDGTLTIRSELNVGSTFTVEFPEGGSSDT